MKSQPQWSRYCKLTILSEYIEAGKQKIFLIFKEPLFPQIDNFHMQTWRQFNLNELTQWFFVAGLLFLIFLPVCCRTTLQWVMVSSSRLWLWHDACWLTYRKYKASNSAITWKWSQGHIFVVRLIISFAKRNFFLIINMMYVTSKVRVARAIHRTNLQFRFKNW